MMKFRILFVIMFSFGMAHLLMSQHVSQLGRFYIEYATGCSPVTVNVTQQDGLGDVSRQYFFEEDQIETTDTFYTYTDPGIYEIVQFIGEDVDPKTDTLIFEVLAPDVPLYQVYQCSSTSAAIEITDNTYDYYIVRLSATDSVVWRQGDPTISYSYPSGNGVVEVEGFYDQSFNGCGVSSRSFNLTNIRTAEVHQSDIVESCLKNYNLYIESTVDPKSKYEVSFQQGTDTYSTIYTGRLTSQSSFPISFDPNQTSYCLRVNTINECSGTRLQGDEICNFIDVSLQSRLSDAYATYDGRHIAIRLDSLAATSVSLQRKSGDASFAPIANIQGTYVDQIPSINRSFDYYLVEGDTCGNRVDSVFVSPPYLRLLDKYPSSNQIQIDIKPPVNQLGTATPSLYIYNQDSTLNEELPLDNLITLPQTIGSDQRMRARYYYADHDVSVYSNEISAEVEVEVFVPKAFTPNGDGLNDQLSLFGLPSNEFDIQIYDRWGRTVHTSSQNPVWQGRIGNKDAESGTYSYRLRFKQLNGELKTQVGTFVLIRK